MISCLVLLGAGQFFIYIKKTMIMVMFCYVVTIPLTEYRERGWGGYYGIHVEVLNNIFFI